ncbi:MAG: putative porin [candidate division Zixibacteria bacterium]|nr:putative porin [candidate division Zixibacteria bacterium]
MKKAVLTIIAAAFLISSVSAGDWTENIKVKGDLRYRHEMIKKDKDADTRTRHRIRTRFGIFAKASDYTNIGIQLATGSNDPISTNQTLDNGFSSKSIVLDLAYFKAKHPQVKGLTLIGGKFKNPFFKPGKSELIWDGDWNPEGGVLKYNHDYSQMSLNLVGGGLWIEERSSDKDSYLAVGQGTLRTKFNERKSSFAIGGGYYYYGNAKEFAPFYDTDDAMGNSTKEFISGTDTSTVYANGYELFEAFAEFTHTFDKIPVMIMGDFVTNTAADSLNTGWLVGFRVGKAKKTGSWEVRYNYRNVEKDAVVGIYTSSDFRGGGTDAKGHVMGGSVAIAPNTFIGVNYFINQTGLEDTTQKDFSRIQVDLQLKFK